MADDSYRNQSRQDSVFPDARRKAGFLYPAS
jgi:hypothetical protein